MQTAFASHLDKVFVEPVPTLFRQLENNIRDLPRSKALNLAIANETGKLPMYCVGMSAWDPEQKKKTVNGSKPWWSQMCSLSRDRLRHKYDMNTLTALQAPVTEVIVRAMNVSTLLKEYGRSPVRYVQIDVEALDDYVLKQLPFGLDGFRPNAIVYEHILIGPKRNRDALKLLQNAGYTTCLLPTDVVAVLVDEARSIA